MISLKCVFLDHSRTRPLFCHSIVDLDQSFRFGSIQTFLEETYHVL